MHFNRTGPCTTRTVFVRVNLHGQLVDLFHDYGISCSERISNWSFSLFSRRLFLKYCRWNFNLVSKPAPFFPVLLIELIIYTRSFPSARQCLRSSHHLFHIKAPTSRFQNPSWIFSDSGYLAKIKLIIAVSSCSSVCCSSFHVFQFVSSTTLKPGSLLHFSHRLHRLPMIICR